MQRLDMGRRNQATRQVLLFLCFCSGFSSLVYQVAWTRMAFTSFGIITPGLSVFPPGALAARSGISWNGTTRKMRPLISAEF
jgi:hypothetical protein